MLLKKQFPNVKGLIFDMDGVLWRETTPLFNLSAFFDQITMSGYQFVLATNNATKNKQQYQEKLKNFNVNVNLDQIINSAYATAFYMAKNFPQKGSVFVIGEEGLKSTLNDFGFPHDNKNVIAVVVGLDLHITYEKLKTATLLIRQGIPFIGTNPDKTFPSPSGLIPGAGSIIASVEAATDTQPVIIGKPGPIMLDMAFESMGTSPENTLVIGDRLDTDILAGQKCLCKTALVMSGVTTQNDLDHWSPQPDIVLPTAEHLIL